MIVNQLFWMNCGCDHSVLWYKYIEKSSIIDASSQSIFWRKNILKGGLLLTWEHIKWCGTTEELELYYVSVKWWASVKTMHACVQKICRVSGVLVNKLLFRALRKNNVLSWTEQQKSYYSILTNCISSVLTERGRAHRICLSPLRILSFRAFSFNFTWQSSLVQNGSNWANLRVIFNYCKMQVKIGLVKINVPYLYISLLLRGRQQDICLRTSVDIFVWWRASVLIFP